MSAIEAIVAAAYTPYIARMGQTPGPMRDDYAARIAAGQVTVVESDGLLGLLVLIPQSPKMLLDNIAVHPDAAGQGIGGRLMAHAEGEARAAGHTHIRLYTNIA
ncbi:MAG: GNAT family N-acetyltransferase, partial [Pseudomonadota bacterium]